MKPVDLFSALWLLLLLVGVGYVSGAFAASRASSPSPQPTAAAAQSVRDASGRVLPVRPYKHIASATMLADGLLFELAEPERILALSHHGRQQDPDRHRYGNRPEVSGLRDLERLLQLRADLLIVNHLGAESELARARASGLAVFDLGEMRGLQTLQASMLALATLLGDRARGERLWQRFFRRLSAVAPAGAGERPGAMYLAVYAGKLYGGTRGTSYHDVLEAAGLLDVAAAQYRDWPHYDPEQLLALDPAWVVTEIGMGRALCENPWLSGLRACAHARAHIVELAPRLIGDPGLGMLDAAEAVHERVVAAQTR
jgi:iron complex transport system substrate-binding protein